MEKRKKWHLLLILSVIVLTIYNILPTLFFYSKPLNKPVDAHLAQETLSHWKSRLQALQKESLDWVQSYCDLLHLHPLSIEEEPEYPYKIRVTFSKNQEAKKLRKYLPQAGALITPSYQQLFLPSQDIEAHPKTVWIQKNFISTFPGENLKDLFFFSWKKDPSGLPTEGYQKIVWNRIASIASTITSPSSYANGIQSLDTKEISLFQSQMLEELAYSFVNFSSIFGEDSPITHRYFASLSLAQKSDSLPTIFHHWTQLRDQAKLHRLGLQKKEKELKKLDQSLSTKEQNLLQLAKRKEDLLLEAETLAKKHLSLLEKRLPSLNYSDYWQLCQKEYQKNPHASSFAIDFSSFHPLLQKLVINWEKNEIALYLQKDFLERKHTLSALAQEKAEQLLVSEMARINHSTQEDFILKEQEFHTPIDHQENMQSFLAIDLAQLASLESRQLASFLCSSWKPKHPDLQAENFPVVSSSVYSSLPQSKQAFCLLLQQPEERKSSPIKWGSLSIFAKGFQKILEKYEGDPHNEDAYQLQQDFASLQKLLQEQGFQTYPGEILSPSYKQDIVFEKENFYQNLLSATREKFHVLGNQTYAVLEFSNLEERILTENKIDNELHEELIQARDDYYTAQATNSYQKWLIPKPKQNVWVHNLLLNVKKYFRGDERKILHWGLDLLGGKTVTLELLDSQRKPVQNEADLEESLNELYSRVNKMGVSEVTLHREGSHIILDFPGSQNLSASELVQASSMYFHLVNEKFSTKNPSLAPYVETFLQQVWNEALVTHKKEAENLQKIAYKHLYGEDPQKTGVQPRSEAAKILYENGLRLAHPSEASSSPFNDTLCKVALFREEKNPLRERQGHPLCLVFHHFALEGKHLQNIQASYDPSKGNFLSFEVKGPYTTKEGEKINPQEIFHEWTLPFSKENIAGTSEDYLQGHGWRMAVILNDSIISSPVLDAALKESASISGHFSPRELQRFVSDLKAGSLTFTPHILSEKNISPELGSQERAMGILAPLVALLLVIAAMVGYYRFCGFIASVAVLFNLLILWAVLQNLQATLTLATIAGVILTVGMAVDANVLVFERMKEEFAISKRLSQALASGYRKAFSAILDSNLTTMLAAFILLNFDAGPIKGFALTLIIGILSSLFTALFMTRFFFSYWLEKKKEPSLNMSHWIQLDRFDFLKKAPFIFMASLLVMALGVGALATKKSALFGMDFTGGYVFNIELKPDPTLSSYREKVEKALYQAGATPQEVQVQELSPSNYLRIKLGVSLERGGRPFSNLPTSSSATNPKIQWVLEALQKEHLEIAPSSLASLEQSWSSMSGQMSSTMRNQALLGLLLALVSMLLYITFRFEFAFAAAAILCTLHDVGITVACIFLFHVCGLSVSFDLHTMAAIMTIIGYSVNDTIIIFDRIREDLKKMPKQPLTQIMNHAINTTFSRTTITSGTTLLVLLSLVFLGGPSLFNFSFVMSLGVLLGTLSSLFIAPLFLQFFQKKEGVSLVKISEN